MAKIRSFLFPCPRQRDATAIVFSLFGICCGWVAAAAPEVSSLFPSGGQRGTTTSVQLHAPGAAPDRIWCSQAKLKAALSTEPGRMTVTIPSNADFGVYELRFINQEGVSALRRFVVGDLPEINETEPNDLWNKPQKIPYPSIVVNGQHQSTGDADSFSLTLRRGQTVVAALMANRILGGLQDAVLQILGPEGFIIAQNEDDWGADPQLVFTALEDGTYVVRTWAFPQKRKTDINLVGDPRMVYRLTLTTGSFVDHVVPLAIQAGVARKVELRGWNLEDKSEDLDPPLSSVGQRFSWPSHHLANRVPASVLVMPHPTRIEHEPNSLQQSQAVELPLSITGHIDSPRDVDAFRFAAKQGQRLRFEVIARAVGSQMDPVIRIHDSAGVLIKEVDDEGPVLADLDTEFVIPSDGDYRVAVADRFQHHGARYVYLLNITDAVPDYTLSVGSDVFVLTSDKELEIPVTVSRTVGFAEVIEVRAVGLPEGVVVSVAQSEPTGDSSKGVKLTLTLKNAIPNSVPFEIIGKSQCVGTTLVHPAQAPLQTLEASTSKLWLTTLPLVVKQ
jgi:hypothetical protein